MLCQKNETLQNTCDDWKNTATQLQLKIEQQNKHMSQIPSRKSEFVSYILGSDEICNFYTELPSIKCS